MSDLQYVALAYGAIWLGVGAYVLRLAVLGKDLRRDVRLLEQILGAEAAERGEAELPEPGSARAAVALSSQADAGGEFLHRVWWRRQDAFRLLLAGLPVVTIATVAVGFWVLSLVRGDEYMILPVGSLAPAFNLPTVTGGEVSLDEHLGTHPLLLFFNEGMG